MISKTLRIRAIGEEQLLLQEMFHPSKQRTARCFRVFSDTLSGTSPANHHHPCQHVRSGEQTGRFQPVLTRGTSIGPRALATPADEALHSHLPKTGMLFATATQQTPERDLCRASHYGPALTRVKHLLARARKSFAGRDHSFRNPTSTLNPSSRVCDTRRSSRRWWWELHPWLVPPS